jgi:Ca-activated chloride channel family protein
VRTSTKAFSDRERKSKALILITDGESHGGDVIAAAEEAQREGIKIFCIGIGQEGGAPIPLPGDSGGFKKAASGELILTKLDEVTLQKIALQTGGSYVRSITGNLDLEEIYQKGIKERIEQKELKSARRKRWEERFQWLALVAFVLIVGESLFSDKKRIT